MLHGYILNIKRSFSTSKPLNLIEGDSDTESIYPEEEVDLNSVTRDTSNVPEKLDQSKKDLETVRNRFEASADTLSREQQSYEDKFNILSDRIPQGVRQGLKVVHDAKVNDGMRQFHNDELDHVSTVLEVKEAKQEHLAGLRVAAEVYADLGPAEQKVLDRLDKRCAKMYKNLGTAFGNVSIAEENVTNLTAEKEARERMAQEPKPSLVDDYADLSQEMPDYTGGDD